MSAPKLPAPSYAVSRDVRFNDVSLDCVLLGTVGSPEVEQLLVWDELARSDQNLAQRLLNDYGVAPAAGNTNFAAAGGFQDIVLSTDPAGSPQTTGLDARSYSLTVQYQVGSPLVTLTETATFDGSTAQTYAALVVALNGGGLSATTASITGGNLRITHNTTGGRNNVRIIEPQSSLIPALNGFNGLSEPRVGLEANDVLAMFTLNKVAGAAAITKLPVFGRGPLPFKTRPRVTTAVYYDGANWVRSIDDTTV